MEDQSRSFKLKKGATGVTVILGTLLLFFTLSAKVNAQTSSPEILLTWKTSGSYIPSFYPDKALPTYGSKITASMELLSGGNIVNLQGQTIYWYMNDTLIENTTGDQQITFSPFGEPPTLVTLKVELPNYNGNIVIHEVEIPLVSPQAVIYAPYPGDVVSNNPVVLDAFPYFFNTPSASDLSYDWSVNDQSGSSTENPEEADINIPLGTPSGSPLGVDLTVKNSADATSAEGSTNLTYQSSL